MKILIIDIETTGFLQANGKIVEIGMVELDLTNGKTEIVFDSVCHERPITLQEVENSWIINNSDLTVDLIRNSPQLRDIEEYVQKTIDAYENGCTAFNNAFDFGFLEDRGFEFKKKLDCPMKLATPIMKLPKKNGYGGFKYPNVMEAYKYFVSEEEYIEKHRGADDALHEAQIVYELYKRGIFKP